VPRSKKLISGPLEDIWPLKDAAVPSQLAEQVDRKPLERLVLETHPVGKSDFGNRPYQPLTLPKAILQQK
jgi:hypothetical protein